MATLQEVKPDLERMIDVIRGTNRSLYQTLPDDAEDIGQIIMQLGDLADKLDDKIRESQDKESLRQLQQDIKTHLDYIEYAIIKHDKCEPCSNDELIVHRVMEGVTHQIMGLWDYNFKEDNMSKINGDHAGNEIKDNNEVKKVLASTESEDGKMMDFTEFDMKAVSMDPAQEIAW